MSHSFWNNQRRHFSAITTLVERVDDSISIVTAFSVSSNLYHICLQLLRSFQWEVFFCQSFLSKTYNFVCDCFLLFCVNILKCEIQGRKKQLSKRHISGFHCVSSYIERCWSAWQQHESMKNRRNQPKSFEPFHSMDMIQR